MDIKSQIITLRAIPSTLSRLWATFCYDYSWWKEKRL